MAERRNALSEEDIYLGGSPVDDLRRTVNTRGYTPAQAAQNRNALAWEALSVIPGPGNAISAYDAYSGAGDTWNALNEGRYRDAGFSGVLAALSGAGAVLGLPVGKAAKEAASTGRNALHIFAGPTARTADQNALATAQDMAASGASREEIWANTGWFQGVDGKWRFEIDDSVAHLSGFDRAGTNFTGINHTALAAAYGATPTIYGTIGKDLPMEGRYLADPSGLGRPPYITAQGSDANAAKSTSLHELQHHIQNREDFAPGTSPFTVMGELDETGSPEYRQFYEDVIINRKYGQGDDPKFLAARARLDEMMHREMMEGYRRTSGEVEARNVQTRMNMSAAERRAKAPWLTQDVPDDQQIVRAGRGVQASMDSRWGSSPSAAFNAVAAERAGGTVTNLDGRPMAYFQDKIINPDKRDVRLLLSSIARYGNRTEGGAITPLRWSADADGNIHIGDGFHWTHNSLAQAGGGRPIDVTGYVSDDGRFIQVSRNAIPYDSIPSVKEKLETLSNGPILRLDDTSDRMHEFLIRSRQQR